MILEAIFKSIIIWGCLGYFFWLISKIYLEFIIFVFVEENELQILKKKFGPFPFNRVYLYLLKKAKDEKDDNLIFHLKIYYYLNEISFYLMITCVVLLFLFFIFFCSVEKGWIVRGTP